MARVKRYGSTMAVNDLSFSIRPDLVTGFLGPNGVARRRATGFSLGMGRRLGTVSALLGGIAAHAT